MSKHSDTLIWLDRQEARIFQVTADAASKFVVRPDVHRPKSHQEVRSPDGLPANPDSAFFERIAAHMQIRTGRSSRVPETSSSSSSTIWTCTTRLWRRASTAWRRSMTSVTMR